jgi:hypothetical protein
MFRTKTFNSSCPVINSIEELESTALVKDLPTSWQQTKQMSDWIELNNLIHLNFGNVWGILIELVQSARKAQCEQTRLGGPRESGRDGEKKGTSP